MRKPEPCAADVIDELITVGLAMGGRRGHMFGHPAVYVGRRLAACACDNGIGLKLPAQLAQTLIAQGHAAPFQPYGKTRMREWAHLPAATRVDVAAHTDLIAKSIAFVGKRDANDVDP